MCRLCKEYDTCKHLCDKILKLLSNGKRNNDTYSDATVEMMNIQFDQNILDQVLYTTSLSEEAYSRVQKVIIAILSPEQKSLLYMISQGKSQKEIGDMLKISQSGVSQKLRTIKRELKTQFAEMLDTIL